MTLPTDIWQRETYYLKGDKMTQQPPRTMETEVIARLEAEIAKLRQDKAELVEVLKEVIANLQSCHKILNHNDRYSAQLTANVVSWDRAKAALMKLERNDDGDIRCFEISANIS